MDDIAFRSPIPAGDMSGPNLRISDETVGPKYRPVDEVFGAVVPGRAARDNGVLVYCTSPNEWTVLGAAPPEVQAVDLTHVRAIVRITGPDSRRLLAKVCSLDFSDRMFPDRSAARTSVAGTATEIVRDDEAGVESFLLVTSRSFAGYLHGVLVDQAGEFGIVPH